MPEASLGVCVLDGVHMHGVPWQRQSFTLSPPSGEEEGDNKAFPGLGGLLRVLPQPLVRLPDCVVILPDHVIEAVRPAGPVRYRAPQKKSKRAHLQGPEQEAEDWQDWACHFSEEWDLGLGWDQNLSHGL